MPAETSLLADTMYGPLPGRDELFSSSMQETDPFPANFTGAGDTVKHHSFENHSCKQPVLVNLTTSCTSLLDRVCIASETSMASSLTLGASYQSSLVAITSCCTCRMHELQCIKE